MVYESPNKTYDFRKFKTIRAFGNEIRSNIIDLDEASHKQNGLLNYIKEFNKSTKLRNAESKKIKENVFNSVKALVDGREMVFKAFESGIFSRLKISQEGEGIKILTSNQMLKRLPIALAQIKAGNNSETLLNEIRQIVYSLHRSKEITKKVYNNIIKSIKV